MSFPVSISLQKELRTSAGIEEVYSLLADVPRSASHFPKVEQFIALADNAWRWEMEKIALGDHVLQQTIYACRYSADPATCTVSWEPVEGVGNALVSGSWKVEPDGEGSRAILESKGDLTVELPGILQLILSPLVTFEFTQLADRYIENLRQTLQGAA